MCRWIGRRGVRRCVYHGRKKPNRRSRRHKRLRKKGLNGTKYDTSIYITQSNVHNTRLNIITQYYDDVCRVLRFAVRVNLNIVCTRSTAEPESHIITIVMTDLATHMYIYERWKLISKTVYDVRLFDLLPWRTPRGAHMYIYIKYIRTNGIRSESYIS